MKIVYTNDQKVLYYSTELFGSRLTFFTFRFFFIIISDFALNKKQISRLHAKKLSTFLEILQSFIPKEEDIITVLSLILLSRTVWYFKMETLDSDPSILYPYLTIYLSDLSVLLNFCLRTFRKYLSST